MNKKTQFPEKKECLRTATYTKNEIIAPTEKIRNHFFIIQGGSVGSYYKYSKTMVEVFTNGRLEIAGKMLVPSSIESYFVRALEKVSVGIVDTAVFFKALSLTPPWFSTLLKNIVVRFSNLSNMGRVYSPHENSTRLVHTIICMFRCSKLKKGRFFLLEKARLEERISKMITMEVSLVKEYIASFERKELFFNDTFEGKECFAVDAFDIMDLYIEYLELQKEGKHFIEADVPEETLIFLNNASYVAQKDGFIEKGRVRIGLSFLEKEFAQEEQENFCKTQLVKALKLPLSVVDYDKNSETVGIDTRVQRRINKIRVCLPHFERK